MKSVKVLLEFGQDENSSRDGEESDETILRTSPFPLLENCVDNENDATINIAGNPNENPISGAKVTAGQLLECYQDIVKRTNE